MLTKLALFLYATSFFGMMTVAAISLFVSTREQVIAVGSIYLFSMISAVIYMIVDYRRGGVSFVIYFFFLFFIALPALVQVILNEFPWYSSYNYKDLSMAYLTLSLAQIGYFIGELSFDIRVQRSNIQLYSEPTFNVPYYWRSVAGISVVCLLLIMVLGFDHLFVIRAERGGIFHDGGDGMKEQFSFIGRALSLLALIIILQLNRTLITHRDQILFRGAAIFVTILFLVLNYPPGLSRFQLLGATISIFAVYINFFNVGVKVLASIGAAFSLLYGFAAIKTLGSTGSMMAVLGSLKGGGILNYLVRVDFDGFKQIVDTNIYLSDGSYRWGENFLGVILFFVPRGLWTAKPIDSGEIVSVALGYPYNNVSSPLPAEALISFGLIGVFIIFFLLARFVARIELTSLRAISSGIVYQSLILYSLTMGFITIILRGALNGVAPQFATGFLVYFLLRVMHDRKYSSGRPV